jgi:hypothetical protein
MDVGEGNQSLLTAKFQLTVKVWKQHFFIFVQVGMQRVSFAQL